MKGPTGTIVHHPKTNRIGVIVEMPKLPKNGHSLVQFGETVDSKAQEVLDGDLELVPTSYEVSPDVLADAPDYIKNLIADVGSVHVRYGAEKYRVLRMDNGELGIRRVE